MNYAIRWIVIYPVDNAIRRLNNRSLELNSKGRCRSSEKEEESRCLVYTSSKRREIRHFHVIVVHRSRAVTAKKCTRNRDARAKLLT